MKMKYNNDAIVLPFIHSDSLVSTQCQYRYPYCPVQLLGVSLIVIVN